MSAVISECGKYRYRLTREWGAGSRLLYVMLNPSTADATENDRTISRCIAFAQRHGHGCLEVVNLYAFRATKPADLRRAGYPVGPENDRHITDAAHQADVVCLAWGANVDGLERPQIVLPLLRKSGKPVTCLRLTASGYPEHPLFLPASCTLRPFAEAVEEWANRRVTT